MPHSRRYLVRRLNRAENILQMPLVSHRHAAILLLSCMVLTVMVATGFTAIIGFTHLAQDSKSGNVPQSLGLPTKEVSSGSAHDPRQAFRGVQTKLYGSPASLSGNDYMSEAVGNVRHASLGEVLAPKEGQPSLPPANWDEQLGITFTQSFVSMAYNVTAVEQTGSHGYGPAYLLNGLSNTGWWYQVGLSYHWPYKSGGYVPGFSMNYEVFAPNGTSVFPASGGGGLLPFNGPVNPGDTVLLKLYFSGGSVIMYVYDWNTGASASTSYSAEGASYFTGLPNSTSNSNGFFTGLMTEEYHVNPYYGNEAPVTYSDTSFGLSSAWMWIDEYNPYTGEGLFAGTSGPVDYTANPTLLQSYSLDGATEYSNAYVFITGEANAVPVTLSYEVMGGGYGYAPPTLTYTPFGGTTTVTSLSTTPTTYYMEPGSTWSVSEELYGSSSIQRWMTNEQTSSLANTPVTLVYVYYHQYFVPVSYSVVDGGSGYSPPTLSYTSFGIPTNYTMTTSPTSIWVDAGSWSVTNPLPGSGSTQRWVTSEESGTLSSATPIDPTYYHQYFVSFGYTVEYGGVAQAPAVNCTSFGSASSTTANDEGLWVDAGSTYTYQSLLPGSGPKERWVILGPATGSINAAGVVNPVFVHQYYVQIEPNDPAGGSVGEASGWYNATQSLSLTASPNQGWKLVSWVGSGNGSYTGEGFGRITVNSPINETAVFYVGLTITVSGQGSVSYSGPSVSPGVVGPDQSYTLFVAPNTSVFLSERPSSFIYSFNGWGGATPISTTPGEETVAVNAPLSVSATFGYNYAVLGVIGAIVAAAALGGAVGLSRRRIGEQLKP